MIKNIIFDFGDIFINLDKERFFKEMSQIGIAPFSEQTMQLYYQYEKGLISTVNFISLFTQKFQIDKTDLISAWNSILLDFPKYRFDFLKQLSASKKYRLFLLSNTNELHISWIKKHWGMDLYNEFKNCFEQFYLSFEINLRKPDAAIYKYVIEKNNLKASETVFIDDMKENTVVAQKLGLKVWNLIPQKEDVTILKNRVL